MNERSLISLQEVLAPWPASCGLYIVSGTIQLITLMEESLIRYLSTDPGPKNTSLLDPIFWIDSGNYFNAYQIAETAKRRGIDSRKILRQIRIARPFTAFQLQQMLDKVPLSKELEEKGGTDRKPLVVISDLMALFYDPELPDADLKRAFRDFLTRLMRLKRHAVILALLIDRNPSPDRASLLTRILDLADHVHGRHAIKESPKAAIEET